MSRERALWCSSRNLPQIDSVSRRCPAEEGEGEAEGNSHNQRSSCKTKESAPPLQMLEREKRRQERLASFVREASVRLSYVF